MTLLRLATEMCGRGMQIEMAGHLSVKISDTYLLGKLSGSIDEAELTDEQAQVVPLQQGVLHFIILLLSEGA
jgi:hypothetical protein